MFDIPTSRLPADPADWRTVLDGYFAFDLLPQWTVEGANARVDLVPPPAADFYVDPRLADGLAWWSASLEVVDIPATWRDEPSCFVSLNDAWTLLSWSRWLRRRVDAGHEPAEVVILHVDDHEDLMSPRVIAVDGRLTDAITGAEVNVDEPTSVAAAIRSGAIGMGSFMVPFLHRVPRLDIRHLKASMPAGDPVAIGTRFQPDTLLYPGAPRLESDRAATDSATGRYQRTPDVREWAQGLGDAPALLHLDLDYFNNRYDGDSDWQEHPNPHDPPEEVVLGMVDSLFDALEQVGAMDRIEDVTIGISPAFFPAELWEPTVNRILDRLKPHKHLEGSQ